MFTSHWKPKPLSQYFTFCQGYIGSCCLDLRDCPAAGWKCLQVFIMRLYYLTTINLCTHYSLHIRVLNITNNGIITALPVTLEGVLPMLQRLDVGELLSENWRKTNFPYRWEWSQVCLNYSLREKQGKNIYLCKEQDMFGDGKWWRERRTIV